MKKFFKTTFACVLGTLIAGMLFVLIFTFGIIGTVASSVSPEDVEYIPTENTVLKISLNGNVQEREIEDPMAALTSDNTAQLGLDKFRRAIEVATTNDNIKGIYIDARGISAMPASIEEMRNILVEFKENSGKWIYAYADNYTQSDYIIASVADKVILNPIGGVDIHGLGGIQMFYPRLFDKLGVEFLVFRVGTYKSAVEPYMCDKMSDANREQTMVYLNTIWDTYTQGVTASRGFSADHFNEVANAITSLRPTQDMLTYNLVDTTMYRPEFNTWLKTQVGIDEDKSIKFASVSDLASVAQEKNKSKNEIAVVYAVGEITESGGKGINSEDLVPELTKIRKDDDIKAVVFRVNSPGGSAYASEQIWAELEAIQAAGKKIVVSMGDMAASGGYYISCGADYIFAENTTLTGSIGVFGLVPCAEELFTDKLGLQFDAARTHEHGFTFGDVIYQKMGQAESIAMQRNVEYIYDLFTRRCAEGRGVAQDDIKKIAEGRVWAGKTACELGLVDSIGSLDDAIAYAAEAAQLQDYKINTYPAIKTSFERLMEKFGNSTRMTIGAWLLGDDAEYIQNLRNIENISGIQARMDNITIE